TRAAGARRAGRRRGDRASRRGQGIRTLDRGNVSHVPVASARCPSRRRLGYRQRRAAALRLEKASRPETVDEAWRTVAPLSVSGVLVSVAKPTHGHLIDLFGARGSGLGARGSGCWV